MMLEEEAGYNPFVEGGDINDDSGKEMSSFGQSTNGPSFLEGENANYGKRFSFIESPSISSRNQSPAASASNSPSPFLRIVVSPFDDTTTTTTTTTTDTQSLENPFVNDTISLEDNHEAPLPSLPTSPRKSPSLQERLSYSPALSRSPAVPRIPSSPLASSSSSLAPPRSDSPSLFTYKSPPTPRSVVTLEKAEWVPDEYPTSKYSLVCEHCGDEFTFLRRRHHCRVCGHLFCAECIVTITLPATLGFNSSEKSCVRCAYKAIRTRGNFSSTIKNKDGLSFSQKLSGKMQGFFYSMAGMYEGGKFERNISTIAAPRYFSMFQTESLLTASTKFEMRKVVRLRIPTDDGYKLSAHAYIPKGNGPYSILVYIPGGAFVLDTEPDIAPFCKELSCKIGCIVISISYRLAPEHKFPTPWEDCYTAVKWIYESSALDLTRLEKDPKIAICGEGSGGLLAAAVCQMARDRGSPPIRYQLLVTPWLNLSTLNLEKFADSYVLPKELMEWVIARVFRFADDKDGAYASPLLTSSLAHLPPTKIITAGYDPMLNDAEEYANELRKQDVPVSVTRYENSLHNFVGNYADSASELEEAVYECVVCVREVFARGEPEGTNNRPAEPKPRSTTGEENRVADDLVL